jgi:vitamin B12 transporter
MDSPSLGMTWKPADVILVRAYAARGFNIPPFSYTYGDNIVILANPDLRMEQVRSYQAGVETTAVPWVWLKLDAFRHDVTDIIRVTTNPPFSTYNGGKARREGIEIEVKSLPIHGTSLSAGGVFMNTRDMATGITLKNIPQRTYDIGLHYDDPVLKFLLKGHYIYWNSDPSVQGKYNDMIFDLTAARVLSAGSGRSLEAFASIRNLFNGDQYAMSYFKNPGRWMEAGVRYFF